MKKPMLQVLIRGFPCPSSDDSQSRVLLICPGNPGQVPSICTGHQAFHELCLEELCDGQDIPEKLGFWICDYKLSPFAPLLSADCVCRGRFAEFSQKKTKQTRKSGSLPFGLKRRKRKKKAAPAGVTRASKRAAVGSSKPSLHLTCEQVTRELNSATTVDLAIKLDSDTDDGFCSDNSFTWSASDSSTETEPELGNKVPSDCELEMQAEDVPERMMKSDEAKEEEQKVAQLEAERNKRIQAERNSGNSKQKTFCNATLGLLSITLQVASRLATCRHCPAKVAKGTPRFAYAYSRFKFNAYLHPDCVVPHLVQEQSSLDDAKTFLANFLKNDSSAASAAELRHAAQEVERRLLTEMGQSQASGSRSSS